ncbi:MAG: CHAT domain-containing protein [Kofleriaceae bacterium]
MSAVKPEDIEAFAAGELAEADHERVLAAILADDAAGAQLEACLQARAAGAELAVARPKLALVPPVQRSRRRVWVAVAAAALLAAAVVVYVAKQTPHEPVVVANVGDEVNTALAAQRAFEPRLSWPGADRYRAYDTQRGSSPTGAERLSFELLAKIEALGDPEAVVAAHILVGNVARAAQLVDAATTADGWNDRAVLALLAREPETAFLATGRALALAPTHVQATWNRALAAAALGLDRVAASLFDQVAARNEPGWSAEAKTRAAALRAQRARRGAAYDQAQEAADAMVYGGPVQPVLDRTTAFAGLMRLALYDALRMATSPERARELLPVARALDARFGGDVLARHAEHVAQGSFARRATLAPRYAKLRNRELSIDEARALIDEARGDDDLRIGAMVLGGPSFVVEPRYLDEYVRLAEARHDPWFDLLAIEQRARAYFADGDLPRAELELRKGRCDEPTAMLYRCQRITRLQSHIYSLMNRLRAADLTWRRSRALVVDDGMTVFEEELLAIGASIIVTRDTVAGSQHDLASAYFMELELAGAHCSLTGSTRLDLAQSLINRNRIAEARALMASEPPCDVPATADRAFVLGQLVEDPKAITTLLATIAKIRAAPTTPAVDRSLLDHVEGRVLITAKDPRGRTLLAKHVAAPATNPVAKRMRSYSYAVLVEDAGRRGAFAEALQLLAAERTAVLPERCVIGASNDADTVLAVRGADGAFAGVHRPRHPDDPISLPADLAGALTGCETVDVFARAPFYGRAELVPTGLAARFRSAGPVTAMPAAGPSVIVANVPSPPELGLAPLAPFVGPPGVAIVEGAAATPAGVLAAIKTASFVEIHAHSLVEGDAAGSMVVLSADATGNYALGARELASVKLAAAPVIVLASCEAANTGLSLDSTWGLADAFLAAGASAVIASPAPIGDAGAVAFFEAVRAKIAAGATPAVALHAVTQGWPDAAQRRWIDRLVVFQ